MWHGWSPNDVVLTVLLEDFLILILVLLKLVLYCQQGAILQIGKLLDEYFLIDMYAYVYISTYENLLHI